jgi:hypothetical protein
MSLSDDIQSALEADTDLMTLLTGGIFTHVEEISRQNTPEAFDANGEIQPCALIKEGTEIPLRSGYKSATNDPVTIYFYQRQGYDVIEPAMDLAFFDLNEQKIGTNVWNIEFDIRVNQQRDTALECALGSLRFVAKRLR